MVKGCKATLQTCLTNHNKLLAKSASTKKAWNSASKKLEIFKRQKVVVSAQVKSMRSNNRWINFSPLPWPFVPMDINVSFQCSSNILFILLCPFCNRRFELAWDYKIASYRHAYHSWCVTIQFSNSSMLVEGLLGGNACRVVGAFKYHKAM